MGPVRVPSPSPPKKKAAFLMSVVKKKYLYSLKNLLNNFSSLPHIYERIIHGMAKILLKKAVHNNNPRVCLQLINNHAKSTRRGNDITH